MITIDPNDLIVWYRTDKEIAEGLLRSFVVNPDLALTFFQAFISSHRN